MPRKEQSIDSKLKQQSTYDEKWGQYKLHKRICKFCKRTFKWAGRQQTKGYVRAMFNKNCEACVKESLNN